MAYAILPGPTLQHFLERSLADPASVKRQALAYLNLCMGTAQQSDECAAWAGAWASVIATLTFPHSLVLTSCFIARIWRPWSCAMISVWGTTKTFLWSNAAFCWWSVHLSTWIATKNLVFQDLWLFNDLNRRRHIEYRVPLHPLVI